MKSEFIIEVSDSNFDKEVIEKSKKVPVVVDFWASWCGPCMFLGPVLEKAAEEYKGKFILAKLDVDNNMINSQKYGIMSIPNVKMFKGGKIVDEFIGAIPESKVKEWLNKNVK
jgi:putative thioredoxin